ncbi:60S ribosomal protein L7a [Morella rubra]|uniref:60S ribosomal protein L7a n=1 Tax=Morella rubra TaxID=262757 RepID=A0A6A1VL50_9ROSI|nr:60S ribosomal protein L7a [Morella rubra]
MGIVRNIIKFFCLLMRLHLKFLFCEPESKRGGKAPVAATKKKQEKVTNPLFEKRPEQFGIGRAIPPKRDLTRFVKWPKTVQIQRKKRSLKQRLKVPPPLKKITKTLDKNLANDYGAGASDDGADSAGADGARALKLLKIKFIVICC